MGNVESYVSCAWQILKRNAKNAIFTGIKASFIALVGISWERINPADVSTDGNWMLYQSRTMSLRRDDLMAIDMGRLKNKETIILLKIWERDASRGVFEGIHDPFQNDPTFRESQLEIDRTEEVCIHMKKDAQKDFTYHMTQVEYFR